MENKTITVQQDIIFKNQSEDTLKSIVLNDWNNAYSNKTTPLAKRFSDEFYRGFHLAKAEERGSTNHIVIVDENNQKINFERTEINPDFITIALKNKLSPNQETKLHLTYTVKIPSDKFTKYGYSENGEMNLKNWCLTPARYENHQFIQYSNENLDDIANAISNYNIELKVPEKVHVSSDLNSNKLFVKDGFAVYYLIGNNRIDFSLFIESKISFYTFKNDDLEVITNLKGNSVNDIEKAIVINRIIEFTNQFVGKYPNEKIMVSQADYERNPFYGLNQLPSFLSPFQNDFIYELKFLKTYLNNYLKNSLHLDSRKDNWIYDGIQMYAMMKYIDENYPESKMMGSLSKFRLLKNYNLFSLDFNGQYSYFYMLMARKNLDQQLSEPKNNLLKFNEQIANKYKAGLSFKYLDSYLENNIVNTSIQEFYNLNSGKQTHRKDFETILKTNAKKDISWFFNTIVDSREIIDYKFSEVSKTKDSIGFSIKNKTNVAVPIPVYGLNKGEVVFKKWLENPIDSTFSFKRENADKIVINYKNEVPEYNLRNNWKSLKSFNPNNRPIKFTFIKDLEDPYYNQILYVPTLTYNIYDGLTPGVRFHNKTILDKPFQFDVNPTYSATAKTFSGSAALAINQPIRNSTLYSIKYSTSINYFHYAPDATYLKLNPMVQLRIREPNFRDNRKQLIILRQVMVNREKSEYILNTNSENYSIFNAKYFNVKTEVSNHISFVSDFQMSNKFGKLSSEVGFRKLFNDNRQLNLRLYGGSFIFNRSNSDFFSFALDRPTDYLFDYNYYGRSESSGIFSQQYITAEGGFKSKTTIPYANQWMTTFNASYSIWNWIEAYGDIGFVKNKSIGEKFVYDSGIRLNLVTDYFELYFPVYSNNGWEISQPNYNERIRFVATFDPKTLLTLFTRKWF